MKEQTALYPELRFRTARLAKTGDRGAEEAWCSGLAVWFGPAPALCF